MIVTGEPKSLRDLVDRIKADRARAAATGGALAPGDGPSSMMAWLSIVRDVLGVLKRSDPDQLPAAIWRMEAEAGRIGAEEVEELKRELGGIDGVLDYVTRQMPRAGGGDGGGLDVRPPRRGR